MVSRKNVRQCIQWKMCKAKMCENKVQIENQCQLRWPSDPNGDCVFWAYGPVLVSCYSFANKTKC